MNSQFLETRVSELKNSNFTDPKETKIKIIKAFVIDPANPFAISTEFLKISIVCPLSKTRIVTPCRSEGCTHLECFDGESYLKLNHGFSLYQRKTAWTCPICTKKCPFKFLKVDSFFIEILTSKDLPADAKAIIFNRDGSWKAEGAVTKPRLDKTINLGDSILDSTPTDVAGTPEKISSLTKITTEPKVIANPKLEKSTSATSPSTAISTLSKTPQPALTGVRASLTTPSKHSAKNRRHDNNRKVECIPNQSNVANRINSWQNRFTPGIWNDGQLMSSALMSGAAQFSNYNCDVQQRPQSMREDPCMRPARQNLYSWRRDQRPYAREQPFARGQPWPPNRPIFVPRSPHMLYIRGFPASFGSLDVHRFLYSYGGYMSFYKFIPEIRTAYFIFNVNNWYGQTAETIRQLHGYLWYGCVLEVAWSYAPRYTEVRTHY